MFLQVQLQFWQNKGCVVTCDITMLFYPPLDWLLKQAGHGKARNVALQYLVW